jgi:hypothetical protein
MLSLDNVVHHHVRRREKVESLKKDVDTVTNKKTS